MTSIPPPADGTAGHEPRTVGEARPSAGRFPPTGRDAWRPWTAWVAVVTGFGIAVFGGSIIALVVSSATGDSLSHPPSGVTLGGTFFQDLALIGASLLFAHMAGRPTPADFGLRSPGAYAVSPDAARPAPTDAGVRSGATSGDADAVEWQAPAGSVPVVDGIADDVAERRVRRSANRRAIGLLLGVWLSFYAFSAIWVAALSLHEHQTLPQDLGINGAPVNLVLSVFLITVIAPLGEEILFRGYFFRALRNWRGFWPAAILTGLLFGAVHIGSSPIGFTVPLAFFGFALCYLYQRTGSLYATIALHALNNSVALGIAQKWSFGEIVPVMIGAVLTVLMLARLLARVLATRAAAALPPLAAPAG